MERSDGYTGWTYGMKSSSGYVKLTDRTDRSKGEIAWIGHKERSDEYI